MLDDYIRLLSAFGKQESDENYVYYYHSWTAVVTTAAIADRLKVSRGTAKRRLEELESFGLIEQVYAKKNLTMWRLKNHDKYGDMVTAMFIKLTGAKDGDKEVKHLWGRP